MTSPAISVEHLSKVYRIGEKEEVPDTFSGAVKNVLAAPWRNYQRLRGLDAARATSAGAIQAPAADTNSDDRDILWALRDVSFQVNQGDVVGIIGRNGAGKSTLLKILSRITEPTAGRVVLRGRVSSLLEVGTGFHPELTGRENVYMNGTILGMTKREIDRKFDEIVDFSGVEKFLDTPVKRYSSGMQVRLAFAVAAHLEPEILIIDEVLAVGDSAFQQKCIGKMQDVATGGRTVLFVSHNMAAIKTLCNRGIVLADGKVALNGSNDAAINEYAKQFRRISDFVGMRYDSANDQKGIRLTGLYASVGGDQTESVLMGDDVNFHIGYSASQQIQGCRLRVRVLDALDEVVCVLSSDVSSQFDGTLAGEGVVTCCVSKILLMPGTYRIELVLRRGPELLQRVANAGTLEVLKNDMTGTGKLPFDGRYYQPCVWEVQV